MFAAAAVLAISQAVAPPAVAAPATQGVLVYQPEFFAAAQPANAQDMLVRVPGFAVDTGDSVRGFEGAAGNVLVDGQRPASKSDNLNDVLKRIPAAQVARIELIRGGAPGIDMQGRSVLANVVRKSGGGMRGLFVVSDRLVGDDGRHRPAVRLETTGNAGGRNWEGSLVYGEGVDDGSGPGRQVQVDPQGKVVGRSAIASNGDAFQWVGTGAYEQPLLGGRLRVNGRVFKDTYKYEEDNRVVLPTPDLLTTDDTQNTLQTEIGGRFNRSLDARTTLEAVALRQTTDRDYTSLFASNASRGRFFLDRQSSETIGRVVLRRRQNERLSLEAGGEAAINKLDSRSAYAENGVAVSLPAANVGVEEKRGEAFARGTWRPTSKLTLEGGLRAEFSSITGDGDVSVEKSLRFLKPRVAGSWAVDGQTQLRFRFERVVGQLNFDDFVADSSLNTGVVRAGNPDLRPEQAWVSEAAVERRFWSDGALALTLRHSALNHIVDRAPVFAPDGQVFDAPSNIGGGTKDELIADLTLPLGRLGLKGAQLKAKGTWRRSSVEDPTTGENRPISRLRPLDWEARYTHDVAAWKTTFGAEAFGGWRETYYRFDEIEHRKLKTFVVVYAEYRPRPDIAIKAGIDNVTSRGFRRTRYIYSGPRGANPLAQVDDRDIQFGRIYNLRFRKTF